MIKGFRVTNHVGDSLEVVLTDPEESGFVVTSIGGLGPVKSTINTTQMATQDGSIFNSSRISNRNITFNIMFQETTTESIEDIRLKTYKFFPVKKPITLNFYTDNKWVETVGYVESNEPNIFNKQESCTISVICPDPYFYSVNKYGTVLQSTMFSGIVPMFEFPFSNESITDPLLLMSNIETKQINNVLYEGDADVGITIVIYATGSATNLKIYNTSTGGIMTLSSDKITAITGTGIANGDTIRIITSKNEKSATLSRETSDSSDESVKVYNILGAIEQGSDWFMLAKGDNKFAYAVDDGASNLQFSILNKIAYNGV